MTTQALNDLADKVVIANRTGDKILYNGAVFDLLEAVRALDTVSDAQPVAFANWKVGSKSYVPFRTREEAEASVRRSEVSATQNGPYAVAELYASPAPDVRAADLYKEIADLKSRLEATVKIANSWLYELNQLDPTRQRRIDQCLGKS